LNVFASKSTAFAQEKLDDINKTLDDGRNKFLARMLSQLENIENYKNFPVLYTPALQFINHEINVYFESMDKLLDGFKNALESRVMNARENFK
jgi:hypothetical protein